MGDIFYRVQHALYLEWVFQVFQEANCYAICGNGHAMLVGLMDHIHLSICHWPSLLWQMSQFTSETWLMHREPLQRTL